MSSVVGGWAVPAETTYDAHMASQWDAGGECAPAGSRQAHVCVGGGSGSGTPACLGYLGAMMGGRRRVPRPR